MRTTPEAIAAAVLDEKAARDPEIVDAIFRGLRLWLDSHGVLQMPRCVGLPSTTGQVRRVLRNARLIEAGALFEGTPWQRAKQLLQAAETFRLRFWPCWFAMSAPPSQARPVDALIWHAMSAAGGKLPRTTQAFARILATQFDKKI